MENKLEVMVEFQDGQNGIYTNVRKIRFTPDEMELFIRGEKEPQVISLATINDMIVRN